MRCATWSFAVSRGDELQFQEVFGDLVEALGEAHPSKLLLANLAATGGQHVVEADVSLVAVPGVVGLGAGRPTRSEDHRPWERNR